MLISILSLILISILAYYFFKIHRAPKKEQPIVVPEVAEPPSKLKKYNFLEDMNPKVKEEFLGYMKMVDESKVYQDKGDNYMYVKFRGLYIMAKISTRDYKRYIGEEISRAELIYKYYLEEFRNSRKANISWQRVDMPEGLVMTRLYPIPFNDFTHLKNFIYYLLRIDQKQKWTTNLTPNNFIAFTNNTQRLYTMGDQLQRHRTADILFNQCSRACNNDLSFLYMCVSELHNNDGQALIVTKEKDREVLFKSFIKNSSPYDGDYHPLCYIEHADIDTRCYHIHQIMLYRPK